MVLKVDPINFAEKLSRFSEHWAPRVIAEMNDVQFKLVKFQGEFVWHAHQDTDEAFIVLAGEMEVDSRERTVRVCRIYVRDQSIFSRKGACK